MNGLKLYTKTGSFGALPPNDETVTIILQTFYHFDAEGRIREEWVEVDLLAFFTQIGAFPPPTS